MALLRKISQLDSNHRLIVALGTAALSFMLVPGPRLASLHWAIVWSTFALTVLLLAWITILLANPRDLPQLSAMEDSSRSVLLAFVSLAALASLFTVMDVLDSTTRQTPHHQRYCISSTESGQMGVKREEILLSTLNALKNMTFPPLGHR